MRFRDLMQSAGLVLALAVIPLAAGSLAIATPASAQDDPGETIPGLSDDADRFRNKIDSRHSGSATDAEVERADARIRDLRKAADTGGLADALEDRIGLRDDDPAVWLALGRAELDLSAPDKAMQAGWIATELSSDASMKAEGFALVSDALAADKRPDQALTAMQQALDLSPDDPVLRRKMAMLVRAGGLAVRTVQIDADADPARACIRFNLPLSHANTFHPEDWVTLRPTPADATVTREGDQLCISGLPVASTTVATLREGLPGMQGLRLPHATDVTLAVGDRAPMLSFDNRMFLLPRGQAPRISLSSTNIASVKISIAYFSERTIEPWTRDNRLGGVLDGYLANTVDKEQQRIVWSGTATVPHFARNSRLQTVLPLPADAMTLPGLYLVAVQPNDGQPVYGHEAVQPVLQTDLAPTVWRGADGLTVQMRSYADARPRAGVHLRLMARDNDILAETDTDKDGFARFAAPLLHGTGQMAPQSIQGSIASAGSDPADFVSLDLETAAFDLSGRGTDGLPQPGPVDAFLWTDRGIYRPGETVQLMGLVRDSSGRPVTVPTRVRIRRPNNQVFLDVPAEATGGASIHLPVVLGNAVSAGQWTAELLTDPSLPPVGTASFKVDAFVPDRMAVTLGTLPPELVAGRTTPVAVSARFLYGAPAAGLGGTATITLSAGDAPKALAGYRIGLEDEQFAPASSRSPLPVTDADGHSTLQLALNSVPDSTHPVQAELAVSVDDPSGHSASAQATLPVRAAGPLIGIRPDFRDSIDDGAEAGFSVAAIDPDGHRIPLKAHLKLVREEPDWRLVVRGTLASFETVWRDVPMDGRDIDIPAGAPLRFSKRLSFGRYRLEIAQADGLAATSVRFNAGWGVSGNPDVPDNAVLSADHPRYKAGDVARVHIDAPFDGPATLLVLTDRVLSERLVTVSRSGSTVEIPVDAAWGPGAYVAVHAYKPGGAGVRPKRAIGLVWLSIDPSARHLDTRFDAPEVARPGGVSHVRLHVPPGAWASVAAVDEGILHLTDFRTPDPSDHFLGRRRLGIDIRDDWGHLIAPATGESTALSQGGDEGGNGKPNIPQTILSLFQAPVQAGADGIIDVPLALPDFAGQVRLMAVSWTDTGLGSTGTDMLVRDRLVAVPLLPRFLAPGDSARIGLLLQNVELPSGSFAWHLSADGPVALDGPTSQTLQLDRGAQSAPSLVLRATGAGVATLHLAVDGPDGFHALHQASLSVRSSAPRVTQTAIAPLAPGAVETLSPPEDTMLPGTWTASANVGSAVRYDPAALLAALEAYPLFCLEQAASKGLPLTLAPASIPDRAARLQRLVGTVLDRQRFDGGFGLWSSGDEAQSWLSAYATEFLLRARHAGAEVPDPALHDALQFLGGMVDEAGDKPEERAARAYALYDLALGGQSRIGAARVMFESLATLPTPLSRAQLGAALAIGNDRPRADAAFAAADPGQRAFWYKDYGNATRDTAAIVLLMSENGGSHDRIAGLIGHLPGADLKPDGLDTQDMAWLAAAAYGLGGQASPVTVSIDGSRLAPAASIAVPLTRPVRVRNDGSAPIWRSVSITGVPSQPLPAARSGMRVTRRFLTLDGKPLDLDQLHQNTEFVLLLEGRIDTADIEHHASLLQGLPAGWEIAGRLGPGKVDGMDWLGELSPTEATPSADNRYAAVTTLTADRTSFRLAVKLRAVSVGTFSLPGALLSDMYQPALFARQAGASIVVLPPSP